MAAAVSDINHDVHEHYQDSDEELLLSEPSDSGDLGERSDDDFEYTNDTGEREEHFADADGDDDFKSVTDDFEQRHAEEEARVVAAMEDRQKAQAAAERARKVAAGAEDPGTAEDAGGAGGVSSSAHEAAPGSRHAPAERTATSAAPHAASAGGESQSNKSESQEPGSPINVDAIFKRAIDGAEGAQREATTSTTTTDADSTHQRAPEGKVREEVKEVKEERKTEVKHEEAHKAPDTEKAPNGVPAAAAADAKAPPRSSAMPTLPARPGGRSAMPSLPSRPARPAAPASAEGAPPSAPSAGPSLPARPSPPAKPEAPAAPAQPSPKPQDAQPQQPTGSSSLEWGRREGAAAPAQGPTANGTAASRTQGASANGPSANGGGASRTTTTLATANGNSGDSGHNSGNPAGEEEGEAGEIRRKVLGLHVLLLRIAMRLGQNPRSSIVQQVVYRLDLAERIRAPNRGPARRNPFEVAMAEAQRQEAAAGPPEELPFSATIMCVGITGVGKTATIHSLLGLQGAPTAGFGPETKQVRVLSGAINGIRVRFVDTPGLQAAASAIAYNARVLGQIRRAHKKYKPDNVLYFDRMDMVRRDHGDVPVLKALTAALGANMWFNCILVLTHGAAAPPDNNGGPMTYEVYANQRTHGLQQAIRFAAGDTRLLNPVAPAENHAACRRNQAGEPVLPNGQPWKQQLLLLCLSSKILSDADSLLKISASNTGPAMRLQNMLRGQRLPPIPHLLSIMVQPKQPRRYPEDERNIMREDEIAALPTEEERRREMRKRREFLKIRREEAKQEEGAQVAIPAPDPPLPPTFDADVNTHRYRFLEQPGGWLARPFVEPTGLDHDDGIDGLSTERSTVLRRKGQHIGGIPIFAMAQMQKDKNQHMLNADVEASVYHSGRLVSTGALDVMTTQRDVVYTARAETRAKLHKRAKVSGGVTVARLVEEGGPPTKGPVAVGAKLENRLKLHKKAKLVTTLGRMTCKTRMGRENATAGQAELKLRLSDDQRSQVVAGTSFMNFRNDMAIAGNLAAQFSPTPETQVVSRCSLNSKSAGSVSVRVTSHDHPELGYSLLVPVMSAIVNRLRGKDMY